MFCSNCGTKSGGGNFCVKCGNKLSPNVSTTTIMCSSCGIKISQDESVPCPGCGNTSLNTNRITASSVTKIPNDQKLPESTLETLINLLDDDDVDFNLKGVVNVESGDISIRAPKNAEVWSLDPINPCDDCSATEEGVPYFVSCNSCSKSPENYFWIKSGDGDGVYTVIEISKMDQSDEKIVLGIVIVLVPTLEFTQPNVDAALESQDPFMSSIDLANFEDLEAFEITAIELPKDQYLLITDKTTELNSANATISIHFSESTAKTIRFFSFAEFTKNEGSNSIDAEREAIMKRLSELSETTKNMGIPEWSVTPRVIIGLNADWLENKEFYPSKKRPDESELFYDWELFGIGASHIETQGGIAAWFNAMLMSKCYGNIPAAVLPWLLQGAADGDEDCQKALQDPAFTEILSNTKLLSVGLRMGGQEELAVELENTGKLPAFLKKPKFSLKSQFKF